MPIRDETLEAIAGENEKLARENAELQKLVGELEATLAKDTQDWLRVQATQSPTMDPDVALVLKKVLKQEQRLKDLEDDREACRGWFKESEQRLDKLEATCKRFADFLQGQGKL